MMTKTGEHTNIHGVRVTEHICDTCGNTFTICPGIDDYPNCGDIDCTSYDPDTEMTDEEIMDLIDRGPQGPRMIVH